jgi:hypothetical protein
MFLVLSDSHGQLWQRAHKPTCINQTDRAKTRLWPKNGLAQGEFLRSDGFRSLKTGENSAKILLVSLASAFSHSLQKKCTMPQLDRLGIM